MTPKHLHSTTIYLTNEAAEIMGGVFCLYVQASTAPQFDSVRQVYRVYPTKVNWNDSEDTLYELSKEAILSIRYYYVDGQEHDAQE